MRGVYLESVRSPALGSRYRMVHREFSSAVFSQIPEQDTTYAEDSFCVGDEEEEEEPLGQSDPSEEEMCVNFDLFTTEGLSSGRHRYLTRRRKRLDQAGLPGNAPGPLRKKKPSRIIVLSDSSEEETGVSREKPVEADWSRAEQGNVELPTALPSAPSVQHRTGAGGEDTELLLGLEASGSEVLGVLPDHPGRSTSLPPAGPGSGCRKVDLQAPAEVSALWERIPPCSAPACPGPTKPCSAPAGISRGPLESPSLCVLADSREICSGAEVISCLKAQHGLRVQVCSLGTSDYVVSERLAVDRVFLWELQSPGNRNKLRQRLQRLQGLFERICVIVETDRGRAGEASRVFQRTQYYDGVLSALVGAGIRILFSSCQEETAALLKELALGEQRKGAAIRVPTEPQGHRRELLLFYRSIPGLGYGAALALCHSFGSVAAVANSSAAALAAGARLSRSQAERIHRFLRHAFDLRLLPQPLRARGKS
ncbi:FANCM protein, partial [Atrichornis clamosus]|nr:FANCM protein [Atrichornis clamosus]